MVYFKIIGMKRKTKLYFYKINKSEDQELNKKV